MNLETLCQQLQEVVATATTFINSQRGKIAQTHIETKSLNSFVTYVDKGAEELLVAGLQKILPQAGFITEEHTINRQGDVYNWIIDPLDGTTNFIHNLPPFAISVGLTQNNIPVAGVIHELTLNETFYAWQGGGAWLNGQSIQVSQAKTLADSLVATGFPYFDYDLMRSYMASLEFFLKSTHGARRLGSAATDLAYVACGRFEVFYEYSLSPWDVAAGAIIVKEAGGTVTDFAGGNNYLFGKRIVASNTHIHPDFLSTLQQYFR